MNTTPAVTFAVLAATAYAAHTFADHTIGQTDRQAARKALPGRAGWTALAGHLTAYHLILTAMTGLVIALFALPVTPTGATAGLAVSLTTHGLWDRRTPVRWLLEHTRARQLAALNTGGLNGMYLADQALHTACLWAAALVAATL